MFTTPALRRFIDDELGRSPDLIARALAGTLQSLRDVREGAGAGERGDCLELLTHLQRHGEEYKRRALNELRRRVDEELANGLADALAATPQAPAALSLMDESRVDVDIAISQATHAIDAAAEWELRELQTFTSALVGHHHVSAASNPFRPLLYATVLWEAAGAVTPAPSQRALLLRHSSGVIAALLKHAWAAACSRLEELGVQPRTYRTVVLPGAGSSRGVVPPAAPAEGIGKLLATVPTSVPAGHRDRSGTARASNGRAAGDPAPAGTGRGFEDALARLEACLHTPGLQHSGPGDQALAPAARLDHHRDALVASAATAQDGRVIELLSRLFEAIFSDPALAPAFRQVIARLQVAALRVALVDPAVLQSNRHPVWILIDQIGELSSAYRLAEDPRLLALQTFGARLAEEIARAPSPDAAVFHGAVARLDGWLQEQAQAALREAQPAIEALQLTEQRQVLESQWRQQLSTRIASTGATPSVRHFITQTWARVLADVVLRCGESSEATSAHLKTLDDLIWSVQLPDHPQSRQRLVTLLPTLLKRLQAGMAAVQVPPTEQQALLDELMRIHAEALRPGARSGAGSSPSPAAPASGTAVERRRSDMGHGPPAPSGVIDAGSMDTVPAGMIMRSPDPTPELVPAIDDLRAFERRRLFIQGRWSHCQLLWRSERSQFFLFTGDVAGSHHSITRSALDRMNASGLLLPMQSKPLLQRAVDHLSRQAALH